VRRERTSVQGAINCHTSAIGVIKAFATHVTERGFLDRGGRLEFRRRTVLLN